MEDAHPQPRVPGCIAPVAEQIFPAVDPGARRNPSGWLPLDLPQHLHHLCPLVCLHWLNMHTCQGLNLHINNNNDTMSDAKGHHLCPLVCLHWLNMNTCQCLNFHSNNNHDTISDAKRAPSLPLGLPALHKHGHMSVPAWLHTHA